MQSLGRAGKTSRRAHSRQNRALVTARASVYLPDIPCKIEGRIVPDTLGYRKRIGLVVPSTNTTVQPETDALRVPGVTCHTGRVTIKERPLNTEEAFYEHMQMMRDGMGTAIDRRSTASVAALNRFGSKKIAILTPHQPRGDEMVRAYFVEAGFDVVRLKGLKCKTPRLIAQVSQQDIRNALRELDGPDVEALLTVGTALPASAVAALAERWFDKPVIAVNTVSFWDALDR